MGAVRDDQFTSLCAYSPAPGELSCNAAATWHGIVAGPEYDEAMESCDGHLAVMAAIAEHVHPLVHPCGIPGSRFRLPENECCTDWDECSEFPQALAARTP